MSGNSWNGKSGVWTGSGAGSVTGAGSGADSETELGVKLATGIFLSANIPHVCCCCTGVLYSFRSPCSSKKSASV